MMRLMISLCMLCGSSLAFQPLSPKTAFLHPSTISTTTGAWGSSSTSRTTVPPLSMSSSPNKRQRRVRRKNEPAVTKDEVVPSEQQTSAAPTLRPREDSVVEMKIQDVRDVLSGKVAPDVEKIAEKLEEEDDDDDEWEYVDIDEEEDDDEYEYVIEDSSGRKLDSLEQLLADAKSMRVAEKEKDEKKDADESGLNIPESALKVISTIVTVDFFVVIALLVWFLSGIFASYVLKDDGVQIAFNNIFEPVVQPALGILMIGSALSSVFNKEEVDDQQLM